ncbi:hypothetical protein JCM33374_g3168 [Metschnikowia sp. JCM 33374]|nr:hypothetical protein JCM33374_g3168 [Metschnikowia sp. JCM 33374]
MADPSVKPDEDFPSAEKGTLSEGSASFSEDATPLVVVHLPVSETPEPFEISSPSDTQSTVKETQPGEKETQPGEKEIQSIEKETQSTHTPTLPNSQTENPSKTSQLHKSLSSTQHTISISAAESNHNKSGHNTDAQAVQSISSSVLNTHMSIYSEVVPLQVSQEPSVFYAHENGRTFHSPPISGSKEIFMREETENKPLVGSSSGSLSNSAPQVPTSSGAAGTHGGPVGGPNNRPNTLSQEGLHQDHPHTIKNASTKEEYLNSSNNSLHNHMSPGNRSEECRFLSFKEWKKKKEEGSSPDAPEAKAGANVSKELSSISKSLKNSSSLSAYSSTSKSVATFEDKDQGRVYKDKFNYASVKCAATIVKTNSDAKGASAILTEVKDSYLLNKCSAANKFIVIELCQDILVSSVVMGNFELFSSMFRTVKFSVSDRFPVTKGWHELGQFEAQNIRDTQTFNIENPLIWARYLKIEIVSHYGNEFYCPISLVRVHGKTMMEEFKDTDVSTDPFSSGNDPINVPTEESLNDDLHLDPREDECKVVTPYLALNEFLKDLNSSANYCDVPLVHIEVPQSTMTESSNNKPTQESIFQNIVKRLSLLETNATLSLLYVEEQSKLLSDAFYNLETRQVRKFENLLSHINDTMYTQVLYLEKAVEKIKTDSRSLFKAQSYQSLGAINSLRQETLSFGREISFLRKIVIADTLIILALLAYVIITRETLTAEELSGKQKQHETPKQRPKEGESKESQPEIKPFSNRQSRSKVRRRRK